MKILVAFCAWFIFCFAAGWWMASQEHKPEKDENPCETGHRVIANGKFIDCTGPATRTRKYVPVTDQ